MTPDSEDRRPREDDVANENSATETTGLLNSETRTGTVEDGSYGRSGSRRDEVDEGAGGPRHSISTPRAVAIILSTWALMFLQASSMSGVTMVQSAIAEELNAYEDAMWFTTAYLIATSAMAPLAGRLATIFPPRGLALPIAFFFASGGLVTALSHSFWAFILGRVLSGVGGAGIMTLSVILVLELTSKERRGVFVGLVNCGFTIGLSTGAVVYGALLPAIGWRSLFGIQAPIGLIAGLGVFLSIPDSFDSKNQASEKSVKAKLAEIDYLGAFMLVLTIVLFLFGLSGEVQWVPILLSVAALFVFILVEVFVATDPIIPLSVLSSKGVLFSCIAQLGFMSARWTVLFYTPVFVLAVRDYAPAVAGSILIPTNVGFGAGGLIVGWLHVKRNGAFWLPSIVGLAVFGVTMLALSVVGTTSSPAWLFVLVVFLNGLATGASLNYTLAHLLHVSHPDQHFICTSLLGTFRGFGGSFGTAIGGGVFYRLLRQGLVDGFSGLSGGMTDERASLVKKLMGSPALVFNGGLAEAEQNVAIEGYAGASRGTWQAAAALSVLVVLLQAATGWSSPQNQLGDEDADEGEGEADARAALMESEGVGEA